MQKVSRGQYYSRARLKIVLILRMKKINIYMTFIDLQVHKQNPIIPLYINLLQKKKAATQWRTRTQARLTFRIKKNLRRIITNRFQEKSKQKLAKLTVFMHHQLVPIAKETRGIR